jgi:probable phosphoglycerate mutase
MAKELWLIRHGESTANAGLAHPDGVETPLTEKGRRQAQQVADAFTTAPDLIVSSPFLRAQQTAEATIERFPSVKLEEWPVQEFTYLCLEKRSNMTRFERNLRVYLYWKLRNANYVDGNGAESFVELFARVKSLWDEWQSRDEEHVVVFCHSMFIYAFDLALRLNFKTPGPITMNIFRTISGGIAVPNGGTFKCRVSDDGEVWASPARSLSTSMPNFIA